MDLIPAIDLIEGKCVRLTEGNYNTKVIYNEDPLEVAYSFQEIGLNRLHLVDLDGARLGQPQNLKVLEKLASKTSMSIDFGGGLKTTEQVNSVFNAGASQIAVGSIAVKNPEEFSSWIAKFGADKIILGADVKNEKIAVGGWLETTDVWLIDFLKQNLDAGVKQVFVTDINHDGKLQGPAISLYRKVLEEIPELHLIASGGVASMNDLEQLLETGLKGVIIGKALYEGRIVLNDLKRFNETISVSGKSQP